MQAEHNAAPPWESVSGHPVKGAAAHPSMQRKTTSEIVDRLNDTRAQRDSALTDYPSSDERDELIASYSRSIAACEMALKWRGVNNMGRRYES